MSKDLGKILLTKTDAIIESWIKSIREDLDIESAKGLAYKSVRNSIPLVLEALATLLSQALTDKPQMLEDKGLAHGVVRSEQGYDITEIVQEYGLLRKVIFTVLKPDLLAVSSEEMLETIEVIDSVIDRVISLSLESYLEARLHELEELQGQLMLTNQELTRLVETQKEDLSYLAHELKTPLNSIMGFSSLLFQRQQKVERGQDTTLNLQLTEKVIKNGRQLLRLINDALEISRYEAGKMELNLETIDVRSLLRIVTEALEPSARQKDLEIIVDCDLEAYPSGNRALESVETDPLRLQQIITNLVSNAIRYTESGSINISCQNIDNNQWTLIVTDTGIGISPEAQTQVFEPYFRVGTKKTFSPDSTGLGLAIVAKMVELLQGTIDLTSQLNEGSSFTVTFPMSYKEDLKK